jgi:hypothetical protein
MRCPYDMRVWVWKWFGKWKLRFMHACSLYDGDSRTNRACPCLWPGCIRIWGLER